MSKLAQILTHRTALLLGNGITRFANDTSAWADTLQLLARRRGIDLSPNEDGEISTVELFDPLGLQRPDQKDNEL